MKRSYNGDITSKQSSRRGMQVDHLQAQQHLGYHTLRKGAQEHQASRQRIIEHSLLCHTIASIGDCDVVRDGGANEDAGGVDCLGDANIGYKRDLGCSKDKQDDKSGGQQYARHYSSMRLVSVLGQPKKMACGNFSGYSTARACCIHCSTYTARVLCGACEA